jgi:preprotein translocase subunit SecG
LNRFMHSFLTNVPSGLANVLSWSMLVIVAALLTTGIVLVYIYYRKNKRENAVQTVSPA